MSDVTDPASSLVCPAVLPGRTKELASVLARFSRLRLGHFPTPLEPMDRLRADLGCRPRLWIKRDDCTGLSLGGSATRKLEFLMAEALDAGATALITHGTPSSNHLRQTAAAAAKLGLPCHILLHHRTTQPAPTSRRPGPTVLEYLHGATVTHHPAGADMPAALAARRQTLLCEGAVPVVIPEGGATAIGALGYVNCARELIEQANAIGLHIDAMVQPSGDPASQAGLIAGLAALQSRIHLLAVGPHLAPCAPQHRVLGLAQATADLLATGVQIDPAAVRCHSGRPAPDAKRTNAPMGQAIQLLARTEGLLFDPLFSGQGLDALIALIASGHFDAMDNLVFLHTGGGPGLFRPLAPGAPPASEHLPQNPTGEPR